MFEACVDKHRVAYDGSFRVAQASNRADETKINYKKQLAEQVDRISDAQQRLYADNRFSVLLVFQAMDAAGKDSTIRAILSGVNPAWCQVASFKKPSEREIDHDFLWRTTRLLPERGRMGVFNRSQYEEVLVVRVHPKILGYQRLPDFADTPEFWDSRLQSIADQEKHLARNGTVILKFWLNVSPEEQKRRFLSRLQTPKKQWKFSAGDLEEASHWDAYMQAYEAALNATSRPWAPWYAIPADDKRYMRYQVAKTVADSLESLDARYPSPSAKEKAEFAGFEKDLLKSV
ncbi:MAG: PPK2 family polyphosphate kinase [Pseudomonadota bacterium]